MSGTISIPFHTNQHPLKRSLLRNLRFLTPDHMLDALDAHEKYGGLFIPLRQDLEDSSRVIEAVIDEIIEKMPTVFIIPEELRRDVRDH